MKAAHRLRVCLQSIKSGKDSDSPYYKVTGRFDLATDLEEVLASRTRYRRKYRLLSGENATLFKENAALQEQLRKERAAVQSARDQRTEATNEISLKFHNYRQDVDDFMKKLCRALTLPLLSTSGDVLQEVERLRAVLLTQQETTEKEFLRAQEAERQYRTLRQALREVCEAVLPAYKDRDAGQQLSALQSAIEQSRPASPGEGVRKIYEARAYQKRAHPAPTNSQTHRHMLQSALALLMQQPELYPFGDSSWNGIRRRDGRAGQLAHAGACIAALIDMLPPAQQSATQKDHAAYPGEAGDLW